MEDYNQEQLQIIKDNIVLKERPISSLDVVAKEWLTLSSLNEKDDRNKFKKEPNDTYARELLFIDIIVKGGAVVYIFNMIKNFGMISSIVRSTYANMPFQESSQEFNIIMSSIESSVIFGIIFWSFIALFIATKGMSWLKNYVRNKAALSNKKIVKTLVVDDVTKTFISFQSRMLFDNVLGSIDFDQTIANFRTLSNNTHISVKLAEIDGIDGAVVKIINQ